MPPVNPQPTSYLKYSDSPPAAPIAGTLYYDRIDATVKVFDGNQWLVIGNPTPITAEVLWQRVVDIEAERAEEARCG